MEFTGERFIPELQGDIKYEHLHRYALAMELADQKIVLDIATGEGYGAALLAQSARFVVGVDIDSEVIHHATRRYRNGNLSFSVGSCSAIPLADNSIDLVSSFETIEHHNQHEEMLAEIKRVLRPEGILILSSPNRLIYADENDYSNPYHVRELYYEELRELLGRHFRNQYVYGQRLAAGSFISPLNEITASSYQAYSGNSSCITRRICSLGSPTYFIAICSDDSIAELTSSIYLDVEDDLLKSLMSPESSSV